MGFLKDILKGQKMFFWDAFALVNLVLLSFAYFLGEGLSRVFIKKEKVEENIYSFWKDSDLTKKDKKSFLRQF